MTFEEAKNQVAKHNGWPSFEEAEGKLSKHNIGILNTMAAELHAKSQYNQALEDLLNHEKLPTMAKGKITDIVNKLKK